MPSRRIVPIRAIVAVALATGVGCARTPTLYNSPAGGYSVMMPGTPSLNDQNVSAPVGNLVVHTAAVRELLGTEYGVNYVDYPPGTVNLLNRDAILSGEVDNMIRGLKAQQQGRKPTPLGPHPGQEVQFNSGAGVTGEIAGIARIFLVGDRLYQVLSIAPSSNFKPEAAAAFLDSFKLGDGSTAATPTPTPSPVATAPPQPTPFVPAQAQAQAAAGTWGTPDDPDRDCQFHQEAATATITVPGAVHNLAPAPGKANAPRILRPADGDTFAEVRIAEALQPADPPAVGWDISFQGAGLLLWGDRDDFIRLECAAVRRGGQVNSYILFEHHARGGTIESQEAPFAGGPVYFRLERRGDQVAGFYVAEGGKDWVPLRTMTFAAPRASVGVAAVNTSSAPFTARFQNFRSGKP